MGPRTNQDFREGHLTRGEQLWTRRYEWLQSQGYLLRDRYNPKWVPSWRGKDGSHWWQAEDSQLLIVRRHPPFALDLTHTEFRTVELPMLLAYQMEFMSLLRGLTPRSDPMKLTLPSSSAPNPLLPMLVIIVCPYMPCLIYPMSRTGS
jgi:hypothetical protein